MNSNTKIWGIALMISLMLNTFALGMIISDKFSDLRFSRGAHMAGPPPMPPMRHELPPKARMLFKDIRETHHKDIKKQFKAIHQARSAVKAELEKDELNVKALEDSLAALRAAEGKAASHAHEVLVKTATTLNPQERKALAEFIMFSGPGMPPRHFMPTRPDMKMRFSP